MRMREDKMEKETKQCEHLVDGHDCFDLYNCCDCGGIDGEYGCGCRYCFSCNACDVCLEDK